MGKSYWAMDSYNIGVHDWANRVGDGGGGQGLYLDRIIDILLGGGGKDFFHTWKLRGGG